MLELVHFVRTLSLYIYYISFIFSGCWVLNFSSSWPTRSHAASMVPASPARNPWSCTDPAWGIQPAAGGPSPDPLAMAYHVLSHAKMGSFKISGDAQHGTCWMTRITAARLKMERELGFLTCWDDELIFTEILGWGCFQLQWRPDLASTQIREQNHRWWLRLTGEGPVVKGEGLNHLKFQGGSLRKDLCWVPGSLHPSHTSSSPPYSHSEAPGVWIAHN